MVHFLILICIFVLNMVYLQGRSNGCYANVGFWAPIRIHTLNLARANPDQGCFTNTVIIHEWLHVASSASCTCNPPTTETTTFVLCARTCRKAMRHNFDKFATNVVHNMGLPYEHASNMHYGKFAFSNNGQPTMLPIWNDQGLMGQQSFVTGWDWLRSNRHYNCPGAWDAPVEREETPQEKSDE